jgi:hypothetical protein
MHKGAKCRCPLSLPLNHYRSRAHSDQPAEPVERLLKPPAKVCSGVKTSNVKLSFHNISA